ncbi:hypothetical protein ATSB10_29580 [Dyella thiooxydans]|uniref:Uncharacterized protein n=2 Tax=Dyella thiooxydans TaxID=445710 RepID=A0A160N4I8_9GAMM|nr:hypothetical protein ATSB10_29580 [Dyella thiooxydans]
MFHELGKQPNPLDRYLYLQEIGPRLSRANSILAGQMSAFALSELGLYTQAVLAFPLKMSPIEGLVLPDASNWKGVNALDAIANRASDRKIVMINEVHHNAQTRALTLQLLPRLRALGFTYLAIEALGKDPGLAKRGYPLRSSGTEYLQEPLYGEIVREAVRLGFELVHYDYDKAGADVETREVGQAKNLYDRVFAKDPQARLVVAGGYAHVDKAIGRLGQVQPMAMILTKLVGSDPLSIDQAQFLDVDWSDDDYHQLVKRFPSDVPEVLVDRKTGHLWSAKPELYDISVISPPMLSIKAFGNVSNVPPQPVRLEPDGHYVYPKASNVMFRPAWLELGGLRHAYPIDTRLCRDQLPCAVDAHYIGEPNNASPADIYAFFSAGSVTRLYLRPGRYRLRAWTREGRTLSQSNINVH